MVDMVLGTKMFMVKKYWSLLLQIKLLWKFVKEEIILSQTILVSPQAK